MDTKTFAAIVVVVTLLMNVLLAQLGLPARVQCTIAQAAGMHAVLITQY